MQQNINITLFLNIKIDITRKSKNFISVKQRRNDIAENTLVESDLLLAVLQSNNCGQSSRK